MFIVVLWEDEFGELFGSFMSKHPWEALSTEVGRFTTWKPQDSWRVKGVTAADLSLPSGATLLEFNTLPHSEAGQRRLLWTEVIAREMEMRRFDPVSGKMRLYDFETMKCTERPLQAATLVLAAAESSTEPEVLAKLIACATELQP